MKRKPITQRLCVFLTALVLYSACSPSIEDIIEQLGHGGKAGARAKRELLLAKDRSVDPLLKALEEPRFAVARPEIVDVLVSLLMRVEDPRILPTLEHHLRSNPNATVRARIIQKLSLHKRLQPVEAFFAALSDGDGEVRFQALIALGLLTKDLDSEQRNTLRSAARRLLKDEHSEVQLEARALVGVYVKQWVDEARQQTLKGDVALAESLLQQALAYSPNSKLANYRLGRLYFDNGQREQGLEQLKKHNMLVEISPLATMPKIDGRIDDRAWEEATTIDTIYRMSSAAYTVYPSKIRTKVYVGYRQDALYVAVYCHEAHPESLIVSGNTSSYPRDDQVEVAIDGNFDHRTFGHFIINSTGSVLTAWYGERAHFDLSWTHKVESAAFVGPDFWSVESQIYFDERDLPRPRPGDVWGFNVMRSFRGWEHHQWVIDFRDGTGSADKFGFLLFK